MTQRCRFFRGELHVRFRGSSRCLSGHHCVCMYFFIGMNRDLKVDGCPLKENLFPQSALLMNAKCIALP